MRCGEYDAPDQIRRLDSVGRRWLQLQRRSDAATREEAESAAAAAGRGAKRGGLYAESVPTQSRGMRGQVVELDAGAMDLEWNRPCCRCAAALQCTRRRSGRSEQRRVSRRLPRRCPPWLENSKPSSCSCVCDAALVSSSSPCTASRRLSRLVRRPSKWRRRVRRCDRSMMEDHDQAGVWRGDRYVSTK